jgi:hypothetical protein
MREHFGPLCELCRSPKQYFSLTEVRCVECPESIHTAILIAGVLGCVGLIVIIMYALLHIPPRCLRKLSSAAHRLKVKLSTYGLGPKLKIIVVMYQVVLAMPHVYDVNLPPQYYVWMRAFKIFNFEWDEYVMPGSCLSGGFEKRILYRGLVPLAVMLIVLPINVLRELFGQCINCLERVTGRDLDRDGDVGVRGRTKASNTAAASAKHAVSKQPILRAFLDSLPTMCFIAFLFCGTVSVGLFERWSCVAYDIETPAGSSVPDQRFFLRADTSVECIQSDERFKTIILYSWIAIAVWPVAMPLLFLLMLLPSRLAILQRRSTRFVRATSFLHGEYVNTLFFWEVRPPTEL